MQLENKGFLDKVSTIFPFKLILLISGCVSVHYKDKPKKDEEVDLLIDVDQVPTLLQLCKSIVSSHFLWHLDQVFTSYPLIYHELWRLPLDLQEEILEQVVSSNASILTDSILQKILVTSRQKLVIPSCYHITNSTMSYVATHCKSLSCLVLKRCFSEIFNFFASTSRFQLL